MLFDCSDIDLLRLTGFLKNLPVGQEGRYSPRLLTPAVISPLQEYGYLGLTRNGLSYNLKPAGYDLLCSLGFDYPQDKRQPSHLPELHRRFDGASIYLHLLSRAKTGKANLTGIGTMKKTRNGTKRGELNIKL